MLPLARDEPGDQCVQLSVLLHSVNLNLTQVNDGSEMINNNALG